MTTSPKTPIPRPEWLDKHHSEWPPEARTLYTTLANIAQRHLARKKAQTEQHTEPSDPASG